MTLLQSQSAHLFSHRKQIKLENECLMQSLHEDSLILKKSAITQIIVG